MTDGILRFSTHLSKGQAVGFNRGKDGIVSEASFSDWLCQDVALNDAFEEFFLTILYESNDCAETGFASRCLFKFVEETSYIRIGIMALTISVHGAKASRKDSRSTIESIHLKACIVSKAVHTIMLMNVKSFLQSIALEGIGSLGNVFVAANIA